MLSVLFERAAIRTYSPPDIILSRSGSESFSVPEMLWNAWLERTEIAGPLAPFAAR